MINAALIGAGDWGLNLARNIHALEGFSLKWICDKDAERIARIARNYPESRTSENMTEILHNDQVAAVVIATPASLHYEHVKAALEAGKHVLVEKPFALTAQHAQDLLELAGKNNRVLMVGHTFLYNPAVRKVKEIIRSGELGKVFCVYSNRLSLGRLRDDVNVMWNLAPHDVSILLYLFDQMPEHVSAHGFHYLQNKLEDAVYLFLEFPDRLFAFIHNTWLNPTKVRSMTVIGSEKSLIYDDTSADEKVVVYDCGFDKEPAPADSFEAFRMIVRRGEKTVHPIDSTEPLRAEMQHFHECIIEGKPPLTNAANGIAVTRILETAQHSLLQSGTRLPI